MSKDPQGLLNQLQAGDTTALTDVYKLYSRLVLHVCRQYGLDDQDAEDILQETFLALLRNANSIDNGKHMKKWLCTTARHAAIDLLRKRRPTTTVEDHANVTELFPETYQHENECQVVRETIDKICLETNEDTLRLFYVDGKSVKEIAHLQDVAVSTVTTKLTRLRRLFLGEIKAQIESLRKARPW